MEFLKIAKRKTFLSATLHVALNIALAVAVLLSIQTTESLLIAIILIVLSKWRVFAVRPRYWFVNAQANLVDFIVSLGVAMSIYLVALSGANEVAVLVLQILLTVLHIVWLVYVKPKSRRSFIILQAGVALFFGVSVLFSLAYTIPLFVTIGLMWLIGYSVTRHILSSYDETQITLYSLIAAFVIAEIGWLAFHWTVAYRLPFVSEIMVPQVLIVLFCLGFVMYRFYNSYYEHKKVRVNDVLLPTLFSVAVVAVLLLARNGITYGSL